MARKRGVIDFEALIVLATEDTTLDPDELRMSLNRAFKKAEEYLHEGFTVSFGHLGHIQLTISSEGAEEKKDATPHKKKRIKSNFVFGRDFMRRIQDVGLEEFPGK
ncbi:hypothetical protein LJB91_02375 [Bacteroidales bacterium OttesenSCG-928-L03]|nr:hypothetical protein [Bacteroidales bacterium OttesenSCG-928-L03]